MISLAVFSAVLMMIPWQVTTIVESQPAGLHFAIEREFVYMASTRTLRSEQWIAGDKAYQKRGDVVVITRKDLGVRWMVDSAGKTYTEQPLKDAPTTADQANTSGAIVNSTVPEDLRMAGFRYEPDYAWTVSETSETRDINGRSCRRLTAAGDADYAETSLTLWLCPRGESDRAGSSNPAVLDQIRSDSIRKLVEEQLAKRGNPILMSFEENTEPAIAATTIARIRIKVLESAPIPAGIFDLPPGVQKSARPK